ACLPIWASHMNRIGGLIPDVDWKRPDDVINREIDPESGMLATPYCPPSKSEIFVAEDASRVTDEPRVAVVAGRSRFAGERPLKSERTRASGRAVVEDIFENVVHDVADARRRHAFHFHFTALENLSFARRDGEDGDRLRFHAEVGEGGVSVGDFQRRDFE